MAVMVYKTIEIMLCMMICESSRSPECYIETEQAAKTVQKLKRRVESAMLK